MAHYIDADMLRKEIERRIFEDYNGPDTEQNETAQGVCAGLLPFLASLQQEQPVEELEEAADAHIRRVADAAGHPGWDWTTQDIAEAFIAGSKWMAEHLKK